MSAALIRTGGERNSILLPYTVWNEYDDTMAKLKLGELLIAEGKIDQLQLQAALAFQRKWDKRIGQCFIQLGFIQEIELCQVLAKALRLPIIDLSKLDSAKITKDLLTLVSLATARAQRVVPIGLREIRGKVRLILATPDPTNYKVIDEIQFKTGHPVLVMIAPDSDVEWYIRRYYLGETDTLSLNYVSGVSAMPRDTEDKLELDPVSSIFSDVEFTGFTNIGGTNTKSVGEPKLSKLPKRDPSNKD